MRGSPLALVGETVILRPEIGAVIRAGYDPVLPAMARDPSHALAAGRADAGAALGAARAVSRCQRARGGGSVRPVTLCEERAMRLTLMLAALAVLAACGGSFS